jgi:release factor glutamine methyltransferase
LSVAPAVLIPRPETECLVEAVLPVLDNPARPPARVLDMGTGSGAIVIALAHEHPEHRYLALDRSLDALTLARRNARRHGVDGCTDWLCSDWDAALAPHGPAFHLIVSNPPYIRSDDIDGLQPEIRRFEPRSALDGSPDGLASLARIIDRAHHYLTPGGTLALEMGHDQAADVAAAARKTGRYAPVRIVRDYAGHDRVAVMEKSS